MLKRRFLFVLILSSCVIVANACTDTATPQPTVDMSQVRGLLPTISPEAVQEYAQLADEGTLALGKTVYEQNCAECHGLNGEGQFPDAPMEPDETGQLGAPPHNGNGHTWHHDDTLLINYVINGGMGNPEQFYPMPAFGDKLSQAEIEAVIAYIKSFWSEDQRIIQAERSLQVANQ